MPYIAEGDRVKIDSELESLASKIILVTDENNIEGVMNYTISRLVNMSMIAGHTRYSKINRIMGVLECVKQEFYRRLATGYEDKAIAKNGDIPEYNLEV